VLADLQARRSASKDIVAYRELGFYGRLGNQLWQIAGTFGIANRHAAEARFPDWPYLDRFCVPSRHFSTLIPRGADAWAIPRHLPEQFRYYLQDIGLWWHIQRRIRRYFAPSKASRSEMERKFADLLRIPNKTALHVRRGDYVRLYENHPPATEDYYRMAIERLGETSIVVFSDDMEWCREHIGWAKPIRYIDGNEDHEDLFLMTQCQHHIIANSSFSWWGAFLSRNRSPIYPTKWYGPAHAIIDPTLMFPDGWVGIDA
jgi:hypothetical protein